MSNIVWSRSRKIQLLSAQRTLGSVIARVRQDKPDWVVLARIEPWLVRPYMYAFTPRELESVDLSKHALPAQEALNLRETDQSRPVHSYEAWMPPPPRQGAKPCAARALLLDGDDVVTDVGQLRPDIPAGATRGGGTRGIDSTVFRSINLGAGDELGLGDVRGGVTERPRAIEGSSKSEESFSPDGESVEVMLTAEAPAEIPLGDEVPVTVLVGLASEILPFAGGSIITEVSTKEQITAIITVSGVSVEALNPRILKLAPPRENEPSQSVFSIRGRSPGRARIGIIFRQGGTELGTLTLAVNVVDAPQARDEPDTVRAQAVAAPRDTNEDGGLLLLIDEEVEGGIARYRYRVVSAALGFDYEDFTSAPLKVTGGENASTTRAYVESIYKQITERILRNSDDLNNFARELRAIGSELCRQIIPDELARPLWANRSDIKDVLVRSWEPYVPWELLRLRNPDSRNNEIDERFLAEYNLVRSLNGATRPRQLSLRNWSYVAAKYEFNYAKQVGAEIDYLKDVLPQKHGIETSAIEPTIDEVLDALNHPNFDVLHIACHGEASHEDIARSSLIIGDRPAGAGRAEPVTIDARTVSAEANLSERQPLVFLNACESGRLGASLTEWGGWPKTFWERGAGAFVGTSWPVREKPARVFAEAFYEALLGGHALAEAAGMARAAAKELKDASWLAYKVYGHPNARKV